VSQALSGDLNTSLLVLLLLLVLLVLPLLWYSWRAPSWFLSRPPW
jgi:hypothetical protein